MGKALGVIVACGLVIFMASCLSAQQRPRRGIVGKAAPSWKIQKWEHLPDGKETIDVSSLRDEVIYLYCFQSWCPGCHKHGFPTLVEVRKQFKNDPLVAFVAVQTTFEGQRVNTFENARKTAAKFGLTIPLGQSGGAGQRSALMKSYRTGGAPWTIIIDPKGVVRFNDFNIDPKQAIAIIDQLKR